ncbi:hypothetical protein M2167_006379 [Streptomyces sp. SPB4]|nr:hypothetical protein [Streptomyces sp. SPB4]
MCCVNSGRQAPQELHRMTLNACTYPLHSQYHPYCVILNNKGYIQAFHARKGIDFSLFSESTRLRLTPAAAVASDTFGIQADCESVPQIPRIHEPLPLPTRTGRDQSLRRRDANPPDPPASCRRRRHFGHEQQVLTDRAVRAVHKLYDAGVQFAVTSGRPPRGMSMIIEPLALATELAAFNGGRLAAPRTGRRRRPTVGDGGGEVGAVFLLEGEQRGGVVFAQEVNLGHVSSVGARLGLGPRISARPVGPAALRGCPPCAGAPREAGWSGFGPLHGASTGLSQRIFW